MANISVENAAMERQEIMQEKPQDRYAGRCKFTGCSQCGSTDGMQTIHRETMDSMPVEALRLLSTLYYCTGNSAYLFYTCHHCNRAKVIPDGFSALGLDDILCWINIGRPRPGCAALAAEEPVSQIEDSRDSAGLEG